MEESLTYSIDELVNMTIRDTIGLKENTNCRTVACDRCPLWDHDNCKSQLSELVVKRKRVIKGILLWKNLK